MVVVYIQCGRRSDIGGGGQEEKLGNAISVFVRFVGISVTKERKEHSRDGKDVKERHGRVGAGVHACIRRRVCR